jgi:hypothetical protein
MIQQYQKGCKEIMRSGKFQERKDTSIETVKINNVEWMVYPGLNYWRAEKGDIILELFAQNFTYEEIKTKLRNLVNIKK